MTLRLHRTELDDAIVSPSRQVVEQFSATGLKFVRSHSCHRSSYQRAALFSLARIWFAMHGSIGREDAGMRLMAWDHEKSGLRLFAWIRKRKPKHASFVHVAVHPHLATMGLDNVFHDG